jgi:hypothetical protein
MEKSITKPTNLRYGNSRYAKALILMHSIDVMHQECNVGESILSTCMAFTDKTKDNHKARKDLA